MQWGEAEGQRERPGASSPSHWFCSLTGSPELSVRLGIRTVLGFMKSNNAKYSGTVMTDVVSEVCSGAGCVVSPWVLLGMRAEIERCCVSPSQRRWACMRLTAHPSSEPSGATYQVEALGE